jgi:hypothetical protein
LKKLHRPFVFSSTRLTIPVFRTLKADEAHKAALVEPRHVRLSLSGEPEEALVRSRNLDGAKQGSLVILKEWIECQRPNWIDRLIERHVVAQ